VPVLGTLKTMPLPDLLQWLGAARKSGTLQVERNRVQKQLLFEDGQVVGCSSDDPPERLGQFLLSRSRITEDQLRIALAAQQNSGEHLGRIFVEMGALSRDDLAEVLEAKAEETIFSLFDWDDAVFRFLDDVTRSIDGFPVRLRVEDVLLRGVKRYDDVQRIRSVFNDPGIILAHTDEPPPIEVLENEMARTLYETVNGERTVAEILLHVHGSEYLVTKFLYELHESGYVAITGSRSVAPPALPPQPLPAAAVPLAVGTTGPRPAAGEAPGPAAVVAPPAPQAAGDGTDFSQVFDGWSGAVPSGLELLEQSEAHQMTHGLETARRRMLDGDHEAALEVLDRLYRKHPNDESLRRLTAEAEAAFVEQAYRHYLPPNRLLSLARSVQSLEAEHLSPAEFFLLSRIDGTWDVRSIIQISPLREVEVLRTLTRMRERGVIELKEPGSS
jgi:hypothetical protein